MPVIDVDFRPQENTAVDRYFVCCHSSLPDYTLNLMNEYDAKVNYENLHNKSTVKVRDMFCPTSVNKRMLDVAKENNVRLITIFSKL